MTEPDERREAFLRDNPRAVPPGVEPMPEPDPTRAPLITLHEFLHNLAARLSIAKAGSIPILGDELMDAETGETWCSAAAKFARAVPPDSAISVATGANLDAVPTGPGHVTIRLSGNGFHAESVVSRSDLQVLLERLVGPPPVPTFVDRPIETRVKVDPEPEPLKFGPKIYVDSPEDQVRGVTPHPPERGPDPPPKKDNPEDRFR